MAETESNIGIIIQARTGSSRLPGKMIKTFYKDYTLIEIIIKNLLKCEVPLVVATTKNESDNLIADIAQNSSIPVYRGDEEDVLNRFIGAATNAKISKIIRVCGDNPFIDTDALRTLIDRFRECECDYLCYTYDNIPTIKTHFGFWAEGVSLKALQYIANVSTEKDDREHVTHHIYNHPNYFHIKRIPIPSYLHNTNIRLTIDTEEDFELCKTIYQHMAERGLPITISTLYREIEGNVEWKKIMEYQINSNKK